MKPGDHVAWKWGSGIAEGVVKEVHTERTTIVGKGKPITRKGSSNNPAVVIIHKSGNDVIKLASELQKTIKS